MSKKKKEKLKNPKNQSLKRKTGRTAQRFDTNNKPYLLTHTLITFLP